MPFVVKAPGYRVSIQLPVDGRPLRKTLPVVTPHEGWVIVPTRGADGVTGCVLMVTLAEAGEIQPVWFVTVKVYVPAGITDTVVDVPEPVAVTPPGDRITVHDPTAGSPLRTTLPVDDAQVVCVIVPIVGAVGVGG